MLTAQPSRRRLTCAAAAIVMAFTLAACGSPDPAPGVWQVQSGTVLDPAATEVPIEVKRAACSNGETGKTLTPLVEYEQDRIIITARVEGLRARDASCPDNNAVPIVVELSEPIGERELVDALCLDETRSHISYCSTSVRWPMPDDFEGI